MSALATNSGGKEGDYGTLPVYRGSPRTASRASQLRFRAARRRRLFSLLISSAFAFILWISFTGSSLNWEEVWTIARLRVLEVVGGQAGILPWIPIPPGIALESWANWEDDIIDLNVTPPEFVPVATHRECDGIPRLFCAEHTVRFPIDSNFSFISRGEYAKGSFVTLESEDRIGTEAKATIRMAYADKRVLDLIKVCSILHVEQNWDSSRLESVGVGIFTSSENRYPPRFHVVLELPRAAAPTESGGEPEETVTIPRLHTDMPFFRHTFLGEKTFSFGDLRLRSFKEEINVSGVWANSITVSTVNASIQGNFGARSFIVIATESARIDAKFELENRDSGNASIAYLINKNRATNATATFSTVESNPRGIFVVIASSSEGSTDLSIPFAPINSTLYVVGQTLRGEVSGLAPSTYEGTFDLRALRGISSLWAGRTDDPEGRDRRRTLIYDRKNEAEINGETWWGERKKNSRSFILGMVEAPIELIL